MKCRTLNHGSLIWLGTLVSALTAQNLDILDQVTLLSQKLEGNSRSRHIKAQQNKKKPIMIV